MPQEGLSKSSRLRLIKFLVSGVSGRARYKISASGKTLSIFSVVTTFEHPSTIPPYLFTPIIFVPSGATSFIIEDPREPVPTTTIVFPAIGLLNKDINFLFF